VWRWVARPGSRSTIGLSVRRAERNGSRSCFVAGQIHIIAALKSIRCATLAGPSAALLDVFVAVFTSCRDPE